MKQLPLPYFVTLEKVLRSMHTFPDVAFKAAILAVKGNRSAQCLVAQYQRDQAAQVDLLKNI